VRRAVGPRYRTRSQQPGYEPPPPIYIYIYIHMYIYIYSQLFSKAIIITDAGQRSSAKPAVVCLIQIRNAKQAIVEGGGAGLAVRAIEHYPHHHGVREFSAALLITLEVVHQAPVFTLAGARMAVIGATRPLGPPVHPDLGALLEAREHRRGEKAHFGGQGWEKAEMGEEGSWEHLKDQVAAAMKNEGAGGFHKIRFKHRDVVAAVRLSSRILLLLLYYSQA